LSKDCYWYSPVLKARLDERRASAAVKVSTVADLKAVLAMAYRHDLPVTVRGGATGNYGQCIPLCGGLVVDISGLDRIISIGGGVVTTEPGVRVVNLERAVRAQGWEMKCLPSTWVKSTISGFISGGSAGIGSITWGGLREPGMILRLKLLTLEAEPREIVLEGADTLQAFHTYGTNGVIVELQLGLTPARRWDQIAITGLDWAAVAAFAQKIAYDDAVPKRLMSLLEPIFGASFKPLKKWLPAGHSIIWLEVEESVTASIVADAKADGLNVALVIPHQDPKQQPMLMEYGWNHSTLWMLKAHPGHTYLQLRMAPNFVEQSAALQARFPGQVHLHFEFIRTRYSSGEFGLVVPVLIPVIEFVSDDHVRAVIAAAEELGIVGNNPHTCYLDGDPQSPDIAAQLALKRTADPKGLLNPGKFKPAPASAAVAQAMPTFLYA
jgi:FAD/FMN-containing dehydrogenase